MNEAKKFYGKYRGSVTDNNDPLQMGRIRVTVPDVSAVNESSWAMPAAVVAGKQMGTYAVPLVGSGVWVEFEQGDPDFPIWSGCYWGGSSELPGPALEGDSSNPSIVLQTAKQNVIVISDVAGNSGGVMLRSANGKVSIIVNDTGIYIDNGNGAKIEMVGNSVKINDTALVVS